MISPTPSPTSHLKMSSPSIKFPYQKKLTRHYGSIPNPIVTILIKGIYGFEPIDFLVDTGADISMLPMSWAKRIGVKLGDLPSHKMLTASGREVKVYQTSITVKLNKDSEEIKIPCTFTTSRKIPPLLGRTGIFNRLTIEFSHRQKATLFKK